MAQFEKVLADIKCCKIQGAESVAIESVKAFYHVVNSSKARTAAELLKELSRAENLLVKTRPTEPCMRNALRYVLTAVSAEDDLVRMNGRIDEQVKETLEHFRNVREKIVEIGEKKIKNGSVVFTHCHSSTVVDILLAAKKRGKHFEVHNTETRPLFQGRKTALELSKAGIKVSHYVDSAVRLAMKKADICLFGADAIQADGAIINKIGSELFAEVANKYEVPVYFCTNSWKFDPNTVYGVEEPIENRNRDEVWDKAPKNIDIQNPAFERVDADKASGIISELGIYEPLVFVEEVRRAYPWLFGYRIV